MHSFMIPRPAIESPSSHITDHLPVIRCSSSSDIPTALSDHCGFYFSRPALLVLGTLPQESFEEREVCFRYCAEVIAPMAERHSLVVMTDGKSCGLAEVLGKLREIFDFRLLGLKHAEEGDAQGEGVELLHSQVLTIEGVSEAEMLAVRLGILKMIANKPKYHCAAIVCIGGDSKTWTDLRTVLSANYPVVVIGGSGGVAGEIGKVKKYLHDICRVYAWGAPQTEPPYPLESLSLEAAGLLYLYSRPGMHLSVEDGEGNTDHLYHRLKTHFRIYSDR